MTCGFRLALVPRGVKGPTARNLTLRRRRSRLQQAFFPKVRLDGLRKKNVKY